MRDAVVADFRMIPNVTVRTLELDPHSSEEQSAFLREVQSSTFTLVIAPELDGELLRRCDWVREAGGQLMGCDHHSMALTSDKLALARRWTDAGVPTPRTTSFRDGLQTHLRFPLVCKPIHGAGSTATFRIDTHNQLIHFRDNDLFEGFDIESLLLQEFVTGRAVSVAFLVGSRVALPLLPTFQILSQDGRFRYQGGETPIPINLAERAVQLGRRAIDAVEGLLGYVGVDLVLGEAADGTDDFAIEINPRLTTSYVGLRQLANFNIAQAMRDVVLGNPRPLMDWKPERVRFHVDGSVGMQALSESDISRT